jgi:putative flippase GtrA
MVGSINTLFGYSTFALFIYLGIHYALASLLSTVLGVLFNFKTTGILVFKNKDNSLLFRFFGVYSVVYIINVLVLKLLGEAGLDMYLAGAVVIVPLAVLSFVLNKLFVFEVKK